MRDPPVPSPWNRGPILVLYLVLIAILIAVLRLAGRGWIGAITAGLVLAGVLCTLLAVLGSQRH